MRRHMRASLAPNRSQCGDDPVGSRHDGSALRNRAAIGAATAPPTPPPYTTTANATSPRAPTNHACVAGGDPPPNSAVPVLPIVPGGNPAPAAVPLVTTPSILDPSHHPAPGASGRAR